MTRTYTSALASALIAPAWRRNWRGSTRATATLWSRQSLTVADLETFGRVFPPTSLELLEAIVEHEPESIRALADIVDRHPPDVLENGQGWSITGSSNSRTSDVPSGGEIMAEG